MSMNKESLQILASLDSTLKNPGSLLSPDVLRGFRDQIHVLQLLNLESLAKSKKGPKLEEGLNRVLEISGNFLTFLTSLQDTADCVGESEKAMLFGTGSALAGMAEEFITGEDPFNELLFNIIPFVLGRLSEKAYIDSAIAGISNHIQDHGIIINDHYWEMVKDKVRSGEEGMDVALQQMTALKVFLENRDLAVPVRALLFSMLYIALLVARAREMAALAGLV